jgi:hypothetical protein
MGLSGSEVGIDKTNLGARGLAEMPNTPRLTPNATRVIEVLVYPSVQLLDVTGPVQVSRPPTARRMLSESRLPVKRIAQHFAASVRRKRCAAASCG